MAGQATVNVLYLDDNAEDREMFADYFERLSRQRSTDSRPLEYYVECVATVESALFSLGMRTFDILFVDYLLISKTGGQSTSEALLRKLLKQCVRIPVVISTGFEKSSLPEEYLHLLPEQQVFFQRKSEWSPQNLDRLVQQILTTPLKLLFLEDSDTEVVRVRNLLDGIDQYRFELEVAPSAAQVREALRSGHYDVLLADIDINEGSTAVAAETALDERGPAVLLLSATGRDNPALRDLDFEAGHGMHLLAKSEISKASLLSNILSLRNRSRERVRLDALAK